MERIAYFQLEDSENKDVVHTIQVHGRLKFNHHLREMPGAHTTRNTPGEFTRDTESGLPFALPHWML